MSFRLSGKVYLALVVLWVGFMGLFLYQQGQFSDAHGRPAAGAPGVEAELSASADPGGTNTAAQTDPENGLGRLDPSDGSVGSMFSRVPQDFGPQVVLPPPQPMMPSQRTLDALDRRKDWAFMTPEELAGLPTADELLARAEARLTGADRRKPTATERVFRSLGSAQENRLKGNGSRAGEPFGAAGQGNASPDSPGSAASANSREDPRLPGAINESMKGLKSVLANSANGAFGSTPSPFASLFGPEERGPSEADLKAHQEYMRWYQKEILNMPQPSSGSGLLSERSSATAAGTLPAVPGSVRPSGITPQMNSPIPSYVPTTAEEMSSRMLHQWEPGYTPPKVQPPTPQPPQPGFTVPRRPF